MGISTNLNSLLIVTDHDIIEKSNIIRKFLFREKDIYNLKSESAINSVKKMNNKMNCKFYDDLINKDTEVKYNKEFYEKQNAIVMAVDNFEARTYLSNQCEKYNILYFNCRTDGTYANVQAFIPGITTHPIYPKNYKKVVPSCILKMFSSSINHCVLWSLNYFEKFFYENIKNIQIFVVI